MVRVLLFFLILILLSSCAKDVDTVEFTQIETSTNQDLSGIDVFNGELFVVGGEVFNQGIVLNGKELNWTNEESFSDKRLFGIDCNEINCTGVGQDGYYYQYTEVDGWTFVRLPAWNFQRSVSRTASHTVTVSGKSFEDGFIYHITQSNVLDTIVSVAAQMQDVAVVDDKTFIAVGYGTILRSVDGGYNWSYIDQEGDFYHSADFTDENHGIIVGQAGSILLTDDGGLNWETIKKPASLSANRKQFLSVKYINNTNIYIVGDEGLLWNSSDGGRSWEEYKVDTNQNLNDLAELDGKLYIVGDNGYMGFVSL